eukprot:scaffold185964_cov34-Tisochrysis_lutea.AAC.2
MPSSRDRLRAAASLAASARMSSSPPKAPSLDPLVDSSARSESCTRTTPSVSMTTESHLVDDTGFFNRRRVAMRDETSLSW